MAYVKMSNAVIARVVDRVNSMMHNELKALVQPRLTTDDPAAFEHYRRLVWGEHEHLMPPAIPNDWCERHAAVKVKYKGTSEQGYPEVVATAKAVGLFPPQSTYHYYPFVSDKSPQETYGPMYETVVEFLEWGRETKAVREKWGAIASQLEAFLGSMPSLNKAVEAMPGIALYLAQEDKDRLAAEQQKRSKSEPEVPAIDTEAIISAAIAHRMAHSGK